MESRPGPADAGPSQHADGSRRVRLESPTRGSGYTYQQHDGEQDAAFAARVNDAREARGRDDTRHRLTRSDVTNARRGNHPKGFTNLMSGALSKAMIGTGKRVVLGSPTMGSENRYQQHDGEQDAAFAARVNDAREAAGKNVKDHRLTRSDIGNIRQELRRYPKGFINQTPDA
jgi:hypothetical protein